MFVEIAWLTLVLGAVVVIWCIMETTYRFIAWVKYKLYIRRCRLQHGELTWTKAKDFLKQGGNDGN